MIGLGRLVFMFARLDKTISAVRFYMASII